MSDFYRDTTRKIKECGCYFVRQGKGDHEIWFSPITGRNVTVPTKLVNKMTANGVLKQCGIKDFRF